MQSAVLLLSGALTLGACATPGETSAPCRLTAAFDDQADECAPERPVNPDPSATLSAIEAITNAIP